MILRIGVPMLVSRLGSATRSAATMFAAISPELGISEPHLTADGDGVPGQGHQAYRDEDGVEGRRHLDGGHAPHDVAGVEPARDVEGGVPENLGLLDEDVVLDDAVDFSAYELLDFLA